MDEVNGVVTGTVQDGFCVNNQCQKVHTVNEGESKKQLQGGMDNSPPSSFDAAEVSASLNAHCGDGPNLLPLDCPTLLSS